MHSTDLITTTAITPYDYTRYAPDTAEKLRKQADGVRQKLRQMLRSTVSAIIEIGQDLLAVQEHLPHGQFGAWVEAECRFSDRAARRYMRVAEFAADKTDTVSVLSPTTLYMLTAKSAPKEIVADLRGRVEAGEILDDASIKTMLKEARSERQAAANKTREDRRPKAKLSPSEATAQLTKTVGNRRARPSKRKRRPGRRVGARQSRVVRAKPSASTGGRRTTRATEGAAVSKPLPAETVREAVAPDEELALLREFARFVIGRARVSTDPKDHIEWKMLLDRVKRLSGDAPLRPEGDAPPASAAAPSGDGLDIPDFLRRARPAQ